MNPIARNVAGAAPTLVPRPRQAPDHAAGETSTGSSTVLVVSADPLMRRTWASSLRRLTGAAGTVHESTTVAAARALAVHAPTLLLLDDTLHDTPAPGRPTGPGEDRVVAMVRALGLARTDRLVVIGTAHRGEAVAAVLLAGARGYLFGRPDPLLRIQPDPDQRPTPTTTPAQEPTDPDHPSRHTTPVEDVNGIAREVSARECQILQRVADGESNAEIGAALGLSALTVKSHLSRIGKRLGSGDRAHLVLLALRAGVVS